MPATASAFHEYGNYSNPLAGGSLRGSAVDHARDISATVEQASNNEVLGYDAATALANRQAARRNAASISEQEYQKLLAERRDLLTRMFDGGLTGKGARRLRFVRWSLDRIDDARDGPALDRLEAAAALYQKVGSDVRSLLLSLDQNLSRSGKH